MNRGFELEKLQETLAEKKFKLFLTAPKNILMKLGWYSCKRPGADN